MNGPKLLLAVDEGDFAAVRVLLAGGADVNERCRSGQTALMLAAAHGDLEAVRQLLQAGARVNDRREDGMTALIHAAFFGHEAVVHTLLDGGADLKARDWIGMSAFDWARAQGAVEVADLLAAAESQAARPKLVQRSAGVAVENLSGEVLGLPVTGSIAEHNVDPADDLLDMSDVRGLRNHTTSTHSPPAVAQPSKNGHGGERASVGTHAEPPPAQRRFARVEEQPRSPFNWLPGGTARSATARMRESGAGTYGSIGGNFLYGSPASSYKYIGFFFALVVGSALCLWFLLLRL
jgi:hypothetical protein